MIYVTNRDKNYKKELFDIFLHLKRTKLEEMIEEQSKQLENIEEDDLADLLEFLNELNRRKMELASKMGAVVTRL